MSLMELSAVDHHRCSLLKRHAFAVDEEQPRPAVAVAQLKGVVVVQGLDGVGKQRLAENAFVHGIFPGEMEQIRLHPKSGG